MLGDVSRRFEEGPIGTTPHAQEALRAKRGVDLRGVKALLAYRPDGAQPDTRAGMVTRAAARDDGGHQAPAFVPPVTSRSMASRSFSLMKPMFLRTSPPPANTSSEGMAMIR